MGVVQLVLGTGPVVAAVLWLLVAFSIGSWGIILYKLIQISRARRDTAAYMVFMAAKLLPTAMISATKIPVNSIGAACRVCRS